MPQAAPLGESRDDYRLFSCGTFRVSIESKSCVRVAHSLCRETMFQQVFGDDNPLGKFEKNLPAPQFSDPQSNQLGIVSLVRRLNNSIHLIDTTILCNEFLQLVLHPVTPTRTR